MLEPAPKIRRASLPFPVRSNSNSPSIIRVTAQSFK